MAVNSFNAQNPPVNTKGDLFTFSTIPTKLGVGANNTVLTADSTTATGLKWGTVSAGGMTLISTTTISSNAATVTISSIPGTYNQLFLLIENLNVTANGAIALRLNGATSTDYSYVGNWGPVAGGDASSSKAYIPLAYDTSTEFLSSANQVRCVFAVTLPNYTSTLGNKLIIGDAFYLGNSAGGWSNGEVQGGLNQATPAAITSISIYNRTSFFSQGTLKLYGVA